MRISELSEATGVPVPTVKYYLREGLLMPGTRTASNQADYGPDHAHRLRLIRVLRDVGRLGIERIRPVLAGLDDGSLPTHRLLGMVAYALAPPAEQGPVAADLALARADVDRFVDELGWVVNDGAPARRALADALVSLRRLGRDVGPEVFVPYAKAAGRIAASEFRTGPPADAPRDEQVEWVVVGTVVFESALRALLRMAQEHQSALRSP